VSLPIRISPTRTREDIEAVAELFAAYAAALPIDLHYQDFSFELANLPGNYAPPEGELLIAWDDDDRPVGCIGMRPLEYSNRCEMKRLYIVPEARSLGLGKTLTEAIITVARSRGYSELVLDTLPTMDAAANLYRRLGFRQVDAYYRPTPIGTLFMALDLTLPVHAERSR
jgi:ribosomal protein S18 acetylase RimI-like enzyme